MTTHDTRTATGAAAPEPQQPGPAGAASYDAHAITVLDGPDAVRKRPGMYIASTGERGLHHLVQELVDNSVDEALAGVADRIDVTVLADGGVRVVDNGRGIPVGVHPVEKRPAVEVVLTVLHAGGKFGGGGYTFSGGLHGVGLSVVNALSTRLSAEIWTDGHRWTQEYRHGAPTAPLARHEAASRTGTSLTFWADGDIFETTTYSFETLSRRFQEMAFLNRGLTLTLTDERSSARATAAADTTDPDPAAKTVSYRYDGGIAEFVAHLNARKGEPVHPSKVVAAARTRVTARQHQDAQRRRKALASSSLPAKLADCRSDDVDRNELFIVEGDSALGTAKLARNSEFQALLPIRGKILNVQKSSVTDMLKNAECTALLQVVGAGSGRTFDLDAARYGKIIMMTDADVDGSHIRILLLTLFHRYLRPVVEAGRVFAAVPPLHRIELVRPERGQDKYVYTYADHELRDTLREFRSKGIRYKDSVQRYKGLGEMDADQLAETTMDPRHRTLRRINLTDLEAAQAVFDLLMGHDVAPRKEFLARSAATLDRSRIDV
ncbi:toprim domain-containing protein [Streptomyces sp. NPDC127068]|uniref:toprim domain-containing protein n=1 Tax=Streptomyces sp. NPDC127068 TaxID=3347127 RepID=UPI00364CA989